MLGPWQKKGWDYEQSRKFGSHAGKLGPGDGVRWCEQSQPAAKWAPFILRVNACGC